MANHFTFIMSTVLTLVVVIAFGRWDIRKFVDRGQRDDFIRYVDRVYVKTMDMMVGRVNSQGVPVTQFVLIYDMDKLSMRTLTSYKGNLKIINANVLAELVVVDAVLRKDLNCLYSCGCIT